MRRIKSHGGFTILEMISAVAIIAALSVIYLFLLDGYKERRMSEQAAKTLMLAAKVQEDFFVKEHKYFDVEITGNGSELYLSTPDGVKTMVRIPPKVVLSLKTRAKDKPAFTGVAFFVGSKSLHKYDSETGKMVTIVRNADEMG
jgi:prepilin-type N-terminal cleavage/methylation domain-containing protein